MLVSILLSTSVESVKFEVTPPRNLTVPLKIIIIIIIIIIIHL